MQLKLPTSVLLILKQTVLPALNFKHFGSLYMSKYCSICTNFGWSSSYINQKRRENVICVKYLTPCSGQMLVMLKQLKFARTGCWSRAAEKSINQIAYIYICICIYVFTEWLQTLCLVSVLFCTWFVHILENLSLKRWPHWFGPDLHIFYF